MIIAHGGTAGAGDTRYGGTVLFRQNSTADHCQIICEGGSAETASGGSAGFVEDADAASATIIANGGTVSGAFGAVIEFTGGSTGTSTLIANGGIDGGTGGQFRLTALVPGTSPRVELFGNGNVLDRPATIGSVEGDRQIFLGSYDLAIGNNGLSTTFSGVIQDGGSGGTGG